MSVTPLLQQYFGFKERFPEALLLFQVGDFYELFFEDAQKAAAYLGIALTKRGTFEGNPVPLCGVPVHALNHYLVKLVRGGFRVVLCEQLEAARPGKIVERGVTHVLTPGTLTDARLLNERMASYCAALFPADDAYGCAFVEVLTGQIFVTFVAQSDAMQLEAELKRFSPDEIVVPQTKEGVVLEAKVRRLGYVTTLMPFSRSDEGANEAFSSWCASLNSAALEMVERIPAPQGALNLLFNYLKRNQERALEVCTQLFFYTPDDYLLLNAATQRNLELVKNCTDGSDEHTLFAVLDRAATPMGSRMIRKWIVRPLVKKESIEARHGAVGLLIREFQLREKLLALLKETGDFERVVGRIALRRAQLQDYRALIRGLGTIAQIKGALSVYREENGLVRRMADGIDDFGDLLNLLERAINHEHSRTWRIRTGFNEELDRLRMLMKNGAQALADFEMAERMRTKVLSLKVRYSRAQGYTIELTKTHRDKAPIDYERIQTLTNAERYTTPALKDLERDLSRAERESEILEDELYAQVCAEVERVGMALKKSAQLIAQCDAFLGFARSAHEFGFSCPVMHEGRDIMITAGRHPVVAAVLGQSFVGNDVALTDSERTWIITGPNMGGKSTFLRQVALIVLMAQAGSWVPAEKAVLPLVDRIFTRIGAADQVAAGKSTFLVEMEETALICNGATDRSLVILDEVGRGTSTYDGLAIAQAVVEYLHEKVRPRALFATHFHELKRLETLHPGIVAYQAASKQTPEGILLLHKIVKGFADGSFGIEVAKRVNLPPVVLARAQELAEQFRLPAGA
ncbi:TPA: DNA mismatch repair protein MutS [Candidatus Dependentiae bacterium]|nr:MAG: mismatch repair protein MutS protein [candidate division TM6 bacterium GW2011_GWF2_43_87]HBL98619.1 DNA mismatch repair protein MutS [Candidatus Dependentiae bacterium]